MSISVVIPTFNCGRYLRETITSTLGQTAPPFDIIVVDDGSTDDTAQIVAEFGASVKYVHQENAGVSPARNRGLEMASGDWVMFLDADDRLEPDALAVLGAAATGLEAGVVYGNKHTMSDEGRFLATIRNRDCTGPVPSAARACFGGAAF